MIIDGKKCAEEIQQGLTQEVKRLTGRPPCLSFILIGHHPASLLYVKRKTEACRLIGFQAIQHTRPEIISWNELAALIQSLNRDPTVDGILVQLPLPSHLDPTAVNLLIDPSKDVDGFHPLNLGKLLLGDPSGFAPCTPAGIQTLLHFAGISPIGKHVVIVGRSAIVGKPLAALLMQNNAQANATVTLAHSKTAQLSALTRTADILVAAIGQPSFIKAEMVKEGAVVIDVGINVVSAPDNTSGTRLIGDVDFPQVSLKAAAITPVPGGVGPMTIASLMQNLMLSYTRRCGS